MPRAIANALMLSVTVSSPQYLLLIHSDVITKYEFLQLVFHGDNLLRQLRNIYSLVSINVDRVK